MPKQLKYDKILDALQKLLETKELSNISVSEIAQTAEIGKGSIYYYFSSKDAILEALVELCKDGVLSNIPRMGYQVRAVTLKEIMDILKGLHKEGRTVILITHDNEIAAQAKRVIKIRDGKIESDSGQIDPV